MERSAIRAFAWGGGAAVVVCLFDITRFVASYLAILVHELGHAVAGWVFGHPSIPAFDFLYGGGVTLHQDRSALLLLLVYAAFAWGAWAARGRPRLLAAIIATAIVHAALAFTRGHEAVQIAAGHLSELVFAGIFLHRALDGTTLRSDAERPLYAFCGSFVLLHAIGFALRLAMSESARVEYALAKGGGEWMDLSRLSTEYLGWSLAGTAWAYAVLAASVPAIVWVFWARRDDLASAAATLVEIRS